MQRKILIVALLLTSCAQAPAESQHAAGLLVGSALSASRLVANRGGASRIVATPIADQQGRVTANAAELLRTEDGREVFASIVSCALPQSATVFATINGVSFEFPGDIGLAPQWQFAPLDLVGQRWVSACLLARGNIVNLALVMSYRGPNPTLQVDDGEREDWIQEEGAFYGNIFVSPAEPIQGFACRGRDKALGGTVTLDHRKCANPDPARPGFTECGFVFAGDCGSFAANPVCGAFSSNGFYQRCRAAPNGEAFEQVITVFMTP